MCASSLSLRNYTKLSNRARSTSTLTFEPLIKRKIIKVWMIRSIQKAGIIQFWSNMRYTVPRIRATYCERVARRGERSRKDLFLVWKNMRSLSHAASHERWIRQKLQEVQRAKLDICLASSLLIRSGPACRKAWTRTLRLSGLRGSLDRNTKNMFSRERIIVSLEIALDQDAPTFPYLSSLFYLKNSGECNTSNKENKIFYWIFNIFIFENT